MATKAANGWKVDIRPTGRNGRRFRKTLPSQSEALAYERYIIAKHKDDEPWEKQTKDKRKLSDIAEDWHKYHGYTLKTGDERLQLLHATIRGMGDCLATQIDPLDFIAYRKKRIQQGFTENHLNHELSYLKSAFNELIRVDNWKHPNPFAKIKNLKFSDRELTFLTLEQIDTLMREIKNSINKDLETIVKICLSIGCRWGEAQSLKASQIHHGKIHLAKTKTGKNRSIPIDQILADEILEGRPKQGALFKNASDAFGNAIDRAGITLPKGQRTHVLRHTFASHFMMSGGNILDLNKILGHQTIQMTMTYAHLAPEHLQEATKRNPLQLMCGQNVGIEES